jgi:hypothetical protein
MASASRTMSALITSRNNPRVRKVTGMVIMTRMGFRVTFSKAMSRDKIIALRKFST